MHATPYKRVLIKLSGESLFDFDGQANVHISLLRLLKQIEEVTKAGKQIILVVGGGNICRGRNMVKSGAKRITADDVGMLATVINGLIFRDLLDKQKVASRLYSAFQVGNMAGYFDPRRAIEDLEKGYVVISCGGTGNPLVSTDTAASLRAIQLEAEAIFKLTTVDGVFDRDPKLDPGARFLAECSYDDMITQKCGVMDAESYRHAKMFGIPIHIAHYQEENVIKRLLAKDPVGTKVCETGA